jgi:hypothetical protein
VKLDNGQYTGVQEGDVADSTAGDSTSEDFDDATTKKDHGSSE